MEVQKDYLYIYSALIYEDHGLLDINKIHLYAHLIKVKFMNITQKVRIMENMSKWEENTRG